MTAAFPDLISQAQCTEEAFLRHIFVRDQMQEWSKEPLVMARADGVFYWDGIYIEGAGLIYDPWITLAAIAMSTKRVKIGAVLTTPANWPDGDWCSSLEG